MSTLNTLRTKGGVILAVVIGISLLAFLLGDLATSGGTLMNASRMNVGSVDGSKISYQEFLSRVDQLTLVQQIATGNESLNEQESEMIRNQAWEQIVREKTFDPSLEKLGFLVSEEEEMDMATGTYISPVVASIFVNPETGIFDRAFLRNYISNMNQDPTGRARYFWNYLNLEMGQERMMSKYLNLVSKGVYVTSLELEEGLENSNTFYTAQVVSVPYSQIPDSTVNVSNKDIRDYYDRYKKMFRQTDVRDIEYVIFDAVPSERDYEEARRTVETMAEEFRNSDNVQQFVSLNSQFPFDSRYYTAAELGTELGDFAFTASKDEMYGPVFENDVYTLARVTDVREVPDTVGARHIVLPATSQATADSIATAVRNGASFAELAMQHSLDVNSANNGGDLGRFDPNDMIPALADELIKARSGDVFVVSSMYGLHVMEVTYRSATQRKAQLGLITHRVESSNETQQQVYAQASKFASDVNSDANNFNKVVRDNTLSKRVARLQSSNRNVPGIEQSTELVRWAFGAKAGEVSPVITIGEKNIVAIVTDVRDMGYATLEQMRPEIMPLVVTEKKGELISREVAGKTLDQIAQQYGTEVKVSENVNFSTFYMAEVGVEPEVIGAVAGAQPNVTSKPVNGYSGTYVFQVTGKETREETDRALEKAMLEANASTDIQARIYNAVFAMSNIQDMRIRFF